RAYEGDAGLDLHALRDAVLDPGARASIGTGIALEIPEGQAGLVLPRSGLAARHGIALVNAPGLVDAGYRREVSLTLLNPDSPAQATRRASASAASRCAWIFKYSGSVAISMNFARDGYSTSRTRSHSGCFGPITDSRVRAACNRRPPTPRRNGSTASLYRAYA